MKVAAIWIAAAVAAGIGVGEWEAMQGQAGTRIWIALAAVAILAGMLLVKRGWNTGAWAVGLAAWMALGAAAAGMERAAAPENLATRLIERGEIDAEESLRWTGVLRADPVRLPWGVRCEMELEQVEAEGRAVAVMGGLRLTYYFKEREEAQFPSLRAGDRVEVEARARPIRNYRNPGSPDIRATLARRGVHLSASLRSTELLQKTGEERAWKHRLARARGNLLGRVDAMYAQAPEQAAVVRAMLLGDSSFLERDLAEQFQKTSVYHVLVLSGMNVGALAAFFWWAGRRARLSIVATTVVIAVVLALYVGIVEDRPPIQRAALVAAVYLAARLLFRRVDLLNTLGVAATALLVARPSTLMDASFQLSFLAAGVIGALGMPWVERTSAPVRRALSHLNDVTRDAGHAPRAAQLRLDLRAVVGWLGARLPVFGGLAARASTIVTAPLHAALRVWEIVLVSTAIQLVMTPVMAHYFHRVSPAGPLANIPAAVLSALMVPVGFVTLCASFVSSVAGGVLARALGALAWALVATVKWFADAEWASYRIPTPPEWVIAAFFAAAVALAVAVRMKWKWAQVVTVASALGLALVVATYPFAARVERGKLELTFLDVGQGDATLVVWPGGRTMLVDGGGIPGATRTGGLRAGMAPGEQAVSAYLWWRGMKRVDVVVLSHPQQDHMLGLIPVLENFEVGELWVGRGVETTAFGALLRTAEARGVRVVQKRKGEAAEFGGARVEVLWPEETETQERAQNNESLVLRVGFGGVSALLTGDIEKKTERILAENDARVDVEILKVAHHGSNTSTTEELLTVATPQWAVIPVGAGNSYGHPHPKVLERLARAGLWPLRTDRDGAVRLVSDGRRVRVEVQPWEGMRGPLMPVRRETVVATAENPDRQGSERPNRERPRGGGRERDGRR